MLSDEWKKATASNPAPDCVEVRQLPDGWVCVRDSKDQAGPELRFNEREWKAFVAGVRNNEFDWSEVR